jgi:recombinational DNA repair protein RecR
MSKIRRFANFFASGTVYGYECQECGRLSREADPCDECEEEKKDIFIFNAYMNT